MATIRQLWASAWISFAGALAAHATLLVYDGAPFGTASGGYANTSLLGQNPTNPSIVGETGAWTSSDASNTGVIIPTNTGLSLSGLFATTMTGKIRITSSAGANVRSLKRALGPSVGGQSFYFGGLVAYDNFYTNVGSYTVMGFTKTMTPTVAYPADDGILFGFQRSASSTDLILRVMGLTMVLSNAVPPGTYFVGGKVTYNASGNDTIQASVNLGSQEPSVWNVTVVTNLLDAGQALSYVNVGGQVNLNNRFVDFDEWRITTTWHEITGFDPAAPDFARPTTATNVTADSADLIASLATTGASPTHVWAHWSTSNAPLQSAAWAFSNDLGMATSSNQVFTNHIGGTLTANRSWYYRVRAVNAASETWADSVPESLVTGPVWLQALQNASNVGTGIPGAIRIWRPASATNGAYTARYTVSGTAISNVHYQVMPGSITMPEGAASADIAVTPIIDPSLTANQTLTLTLIPGSFVAGVSNSATIQIEGSPPFDTRGWHYRAKLALSGYDRPAVQTGFPLLVTLSTNRIPGFSYGQFATPNRTDLRIVSGAGQAEYSYEVERWNTNGDSHLWTRVQTLATDSVVYVYWGNPAATTPPAYTTNGHVWAGGYVGVWHLSETNGIEHDSTAYANHGACSNAVQQGTNGLIAGCDGFDGSTTWVQAPDSDSLDGMANLTLEAWIYDTAGNATNPRAIAAKRTKTNQHSYFLYKGNNVDQIQFALGSAGGIFTNSATGVNGWHHVAFVFDPTQPAAARGRLCIDGVLRSTYTIGDGVVMPAGVDPFCIGALNPAYQYTWKGMLDEVRVSGVVHTPDWFHAEWLNVMSNTVLPVASPAENLAINRGSTILFQ